MEQYILKSALVAEIERRVNLNDTCQKISGGNEFYRGAIDEAKEILSFLDTLEVKEVDLDEVKIGETKIYLEDDGGEPPYDGKQWLDMSCTEYEIPKDKFNDGDNVAIFIRKLQKGELL